MFSKDLIYLHLVEHSIVVYWLNFLCGIKGLRPQNRRGVTQPKGGPFMREFGGGGLAKASWICVTPLFIEKGAPNPRCIYMWGYLFLLGGGLEGGGIWNTISMYMFSVELVQI